MIMRFFLGVGLVLMGVTSYFVVVVPPPNVQLVPTVAAVTVLQSEGILPAGDLAENEELEHGIFEVPAQDEVMLESAEADMDMGGMDMSGAGDGGGTMTMPDGAVMKESEMPSGGDAAMDMAGGEDTMTMPDGTVMKESEMPSGGDAAMDMAGGEDTMTMPDGTVMKESEMPSGGDAAMDMAGGEDTMTMPDGTVMKESEMPSGGDAAMDMAGGEDTMTMPDGTVMKESEMPSGGDAAMDMDAMDMGEMVMAEGGLAFSDDGPVDREITLAMSEWTFSDLELEVAKGERIRFTVRNEGKILHEFMFMTMPAMAAVNYRAKRADWNLLEHEALFEKSLLLPGGEISFVVEVQQTGNWMFMCMLPYHMQMGMMGQMATPGMAMSM